MNTDPHPIIGWARLLRWQQEAMDPNMAAAKRKIYNTAIEIAKIVHRHWTPVLRYKVKDVEEAQLEEMRESAEWFLKYFDKL